MRNKLAEGIRKVAYFRTSQEIRRAISHPKVTTDVRKCFLNAFQP